VPTNQLPGRSSTGGHSLESDLQGLLLFLPNPTLSAKRDIGVGKKEIAIKVKEKK
jgi:hypothetical protein